MSAHVLVCDCRRCPCAMQVDRAGAICEGCRLGDRCELLIHDDGRHRWADAGSAWSQFSYTCLKCGTRVGSRSERAPSDQGCRVDKRAALDAARKGTGK
jgi:hypothetical protein